MKLAIKTIALCALLGAAGGAHATVVLIPNGNFEIAGGDSWNTNPLPPSLVNTFPATDGNTGGYGKIDATAGAWGGVMVAEGGTGPAPAIADGILLTSIGAGLTAGQEHTFAWEQIDLAGNGKVAGIKIESWAGGAKLSDSGDQLFPTNPTWTAESFDYTIDAGADAIKVVLIQNQGDGITGFDNITVDDEGVTPPPPPPPSKDVPNGDFEAAGLGWGFAEGGGTILAYPATGGSGGGGYASINDPAGTPFAVLFSNPFSLSSLGVAVGDTIIVSMDMLLEAGTNIGGVKIEWGNGDTGDLRIPLIGDGSTWETYSYERTIPAGATSVKIVPLWGPSSQVGYDNIKITCPVEAPFAATITTTTQVNWSPTSPTNSYQPQESADNSIWTNLGPLVIGNTVSSVCDSSESPFYRVQENSIVTGPELVLDPSFEVGGDWNLIGSTPPVEISNLLDGDPTSANTGEYSVRLAVDNGAAGAPESSVLQQVGASGTITPGTSYDFSFWARLESLVGAAGTNYTLNWRKLNGDVIIASAITGDVNSLTIGQWTQITLPGNVAPAEADSIILEFGCVTGADPNQVASWLIDDVSVATVTTTMLGPIAATAAPAVEISWPSESGKSYQVNSGASPDSLTPLGSSMPGTGGVLSLCDAINVAGFYNVVETP